MARESFRLIPVGPGRMAVVVPSLTEERQSIRAQVEHELPLTALADLGINAPSPEDAVIERDQIREDRDRLLIGARRMHETYASVQDQLRPRLIFSRSRRY